MNIEQLLNKLSNKQTVLVKNSAMSNALADIVIYYIEDEPDSIFTKKYKEEIGKDFNYEKTLPLYLKYVKKIDCDCQFDRFYTKILPK